MTESISSVLTSPTFWSNTPSFIILLVALCLMIRVFKVRIKTEHITIGDESAEAFVERTIVREQCDFAHSYLFGLLNKIKVLCPDHKLLHDGWFSKCILEAVYDEVIKWITYNHITEDEAYISVKQNKICTLVYSYDVRPEFKTPEFQARMKRWTEELIRELLKIRKVYTKKLRKGN